MLLRELDQVRGRLDELRKSTRSLGEEMNAVADRLRSDHVIPGAAIRVQINNFRKSFESLSEAIVGADPDPLERITSLNQLDERIQESQQTRQAVEFLESVLRVKHQDDPEFGPLMDCHEKIRQAVEALSSSTDEDHPDVKALLAGEHPSHALLSMIEKADTLGDEEWTLLNDRITDAYGRSLATAAARGRLVISS